MGRDSYHHGNLRAALIEAALAVIRSDGIEAVTLRGLARSVGVSHAAPARHFASRNALFAAIAEEGYRGLIGRVTAAGGAGRDPVERLRLMARAHVAWALENPELHAAMCNPEIARHAGDGLAEMLGGFAQTQLAAVGEAQAAGWRPDAAPELAYLHFAAGLAGIVAVLTDPFTMQMFDPLQVGRLIDALIERLLVP